MRWLMLVLLLASCATTGTNKAPVTTQAAPAPVPAPPALLWEAKAPAGTVYLLGTMHSGVARDKLPSSVGEALTQSGVFVLETDTSSADPQRLADLMMLPQGPGLDAQLGAERWGRLMEMLKGAFTERTASRLQPWVIEAALVRELLPHETSMEGALLAEASSKSMRIEYLEDWEAPILALNKVFEAGALAEIVDDPEGFKSRTRQMTQDYLDGDVEALHQHIFGPEYSSAALFAERNLAWIGRLEQIVTPEAPVFVAVGVGHLLGTESVLTLLAERGYAVKRVE